MPEPITSRDPVPQVEPKEFRLGDSLQWDKVLEDYPSEEWGLTYKIIPQAAGPTVITISAAQAANAQDHEIRVVSATTAAYATGDYWMFGYVIFGANRFEVYAGPMTILANPASATSFDGRTYLERILDLVETSIESNEAPRNVIRYSYGGVSTEVRTLEDALKARQILLAAIANEAAKTLGQQRRVLTRFRMPR